MQTGIFQEAIKAEHQRALERAESSRYAMPPWIAEVLRSHPEWAQEIRSNLENPSTPLSEPPAWLLDAWAGGVSDSGIRVSPMTALQASTVYACVDLIAGAIGAMPLYVYEKTVNSNGRRVKQKAEDNAVFELLFEEPNEEMTSFTFRKTLQCHALLWGNAYAEIQRDNANRPVALWPRHPAHTKPVRDLRTQKMYYVTTDGLENNDDGTPIPNPERKIALQDMVHIPGLSLDGRLGLDTIYLARQAIGTALGQDKFAAKFFGNGAMTTGILTYPAKLDKIQREKMRQSFEASIAGENHWRPIVMEGGADYKPISNSPEASQLVQSREYQRTEVCAIFHVPSHMVGDDSKATKATAEQVGAEYVNYTLSPWIASWQTELKRKLLPSPATGRNAGKKYVVLFDTRKLTFPDGESRSKFYASGKQWGYFSSNDIRDFEDQNPIDSKAADEYWMPVNMSPMTDEKPAASTPAPAPDKTSETQATNESNAIVRSYYRVFQDAFNRYSVREKRDFPTLKRAFEPVISGLSEALSGTAKADSVESHLSNMFARSTEWEANSAETEWNIAVAAFKSTEQA